jgi:DNA invertase Pin-like site-specific DNA recombinase
VQARTFSEHKFLQQTGDFRLVSAAMPRTAHPMTGISAALSNLHRAMHGLVAEHTSMRQQLHSLLRNGGTAGGARRGRPAGRPSSGSRKRGRAFKFTDAQAAEFRKQVEGGKSAASLAKELKISLPTIYSTLKRAGWMPRSGRGRPATRPARAARSTGGGSGSKKHGRPFKFNGGQIAEFRKQVEGGKSTRALAKELKVSLPTMYNTLRRAGWTGRKGRKAKAA